MIMRLSAYKNLKGWYKVGAVRFFSVVPGKEAVGTNWKIVMASEHQEVLLCSVCDRELAYVA